MRKWLPVQKGERYHIEERPFPVFIEQPEMVRRDAEQAAPHDHEEVIAKLVDRIEVKKDYEITIYWRMTADQFLGKKTEASV